MRARCRVGLRLHVVLAESALELVPRKVATSPDVVSDSRRRGLPAAEILLDRSFHHRALEKLEDNFKRGRPDLVHEALLAVTGSPLYMEGKADVWVHTCVDRVLEFKPGTRVPKNYLRFRGLAEKALRGETKGELVSVMNATVKELLKRVIRPDWVLALTTLGKWSSFAGAAETLVTKNEPCVMIGGFPHGHFSPGAMKLADSALKADAIPLEAHVVAARLVYEVEKHLGR
jgi:rRNA small subunit pseudouridine methyltransferase Nep1